MNIVETAEEIDKLKEFIQAIQGNEHNSLSLICC